MIIDVDSRPFIGGLGDTVTLCWLGEGSKGSIDEIVFATGDANKTSLLNLFNQTVITEKEGVVIPSGAYNEELKDCGNLLRLEYIQKYLGITTSYKRPKHVIPQENMDWAIQNSEGSDNTILLFPQTFYKTREWPATYWIDLAYELNKEYRVMVLLNNKDERYLSMPRYYWGQNLLHVAALMSISKLVIGNDSMPAHLAGTLGVKTLAIMGPTKPKTIFGHCENVFCVQSELDCVGCHWRRPPYRPACEQGCSALFALSPQKVIDVVHLKMNER